MIRSALSESNIPCLNWIPCRKLLLSLISKRQLRISALELRGFGNKFAELIRRVAAYSRGPRIA